MMHSKERQRNGGGDRWREDAPRGRERYDEEDERSRGSFATTRGTHRGGAYRDWDEERWRGDLERSEFEDRERGSGDRNRDTPGGSWYGREDDLRDDDWRGRDPYSNRYSGAGEGRDYGYEREDRQSSRYGHGRGFAEDDARRDRSSFGRDDFRGRDRDEDSAEDSHYRGVYRRSSRPYRFAGGSGTITAESWTISGPYAGKGPKGYRRSNEQIVEEASQRLYRHGRIDASDIDVTCEDGVLTLKGTVSDRETKRLAEECVESIFGVHDVANELRVRRQSSQERNEGSEQGRGANTSRKNK